MTNVWDSDVVREIELEFGYEPGFLRSYIRQIPEEESSQGNEIVRIDLDSLCYNPTVDKIRAALDFLAPYEPQNQQEEDWGDYASVIPTSTYRTVITVATEEEARAILLESEWYKESANVSEILCDLNMYQQILQVIKQYSKDRSLEVDSLINSLISSADKLGYYEILVDLFEIIASSSSRNLDVLVRMLAILSRRVLLIREKSALKRVYSTLAGLLTDGIFLDAYRTRDSEMRALLRWFSCHATKTALHEFLPAGYKLNLT